MNKRKDFLLYDLHDLLQGKSRKLKLVSETLTREGPQQQPRWQMGFRVEVVFCDDEGEWAFDYWCPVDDLSIPSRGLLGAPEKRTVDGYIRTCDEMKETNNG